MDKNLPPQPHPHRPTEQEGFFDRVFHPHHEEHHEGEEHHEDEAHFQDESVSPPTSKDAKEHASEGDPYRHYMKDKVEFEEEVGLLT